MKRVIAVVVVLVLLLGGLAYRFFSSAKTRLTPEALVPAPGAPGTLPRRPKHVVIVIEENKDYDDIIGNARAPYLNELAAHAAVFTHAYGVAHPSQPNYFALFAGVTEREGDACNVPDIPTDAANLGTELIAQHDSFTGFAEDLPQAGFTGCTSGLYARKHAPWTHFTNIPPSSSQPFSALPRYDALPTLALIIPNLDNDMHNGSIQRGDAWLKKNLDPLVRWAQTHDTLIIVTWDESDQPINNHIPTLFIGPMVRPGKVDTPVSHYNVLRTLEDLYALKPTGEAAPAPPITNVWR